MSSCGEAMTIQRRKSDSVKIDQNDLFDSRPSKRNAAMRAYASNATDHDRTAGELFLFFFAEKLYIADELFLVDVFGVLNGFFVNWSFFSYLVVNIMN